MYAALSQQLELRALLVGLIASAAEPSVLDKLLQCARRLGGPVTVTVATLGALRGAHVFSRVPSATRLSEPQLAELALLVGAAMTRAGGTRELLRALLFAATGTARAGGASSSAGAHLPTGCTAMS
jgi:hypothetical protein